MLGSPFSLGPVVKNLLIINGLMLLLKIVMGVDALGFNKLDRELALYALSSPNFRPWQLVTHLFMHADFWHLFGNMLGLFMFGSAMEQHWGPKRFLTYYFVCGLGAALLQLGVNAWEIQSHLTDLAPYGVVASDIQGLARLPLDMDFLNSGMALLQERTQAPEGLITRSLMDLIRPMVGASGAVFGILLAYGMTFPNNIVYVQFFIPMKAKYLVMIFGALTLYSGFKNAPGDSVAHFAHLGGMIFGYLLIVYWKSRREI